MGASSTKPCPSCYEAPQSTLEHARDVQICTNVLGMQLDERPVQLARRLPAMRGDEAITLELGNDTLRERATSCSPRLVDGDTPSCSPRLADKDTPVVVTGKYVRISKEVCKFEDDNDMPVMVTTTTGATNDTASGIISLFKLCKSASGAHERQSVVNSYVGEGFATFAACLSAQGLHRGVQIFTLVGNFGDIFREGTAVVVHGKQTDDKDRMERWYRKSAPDMGPRDMLTGFISHSWATSGLKKGMALSMYFMNSRASSAMFVFLVLVGIPLILGLKNADVGDDQVFLALGLVILASYMCYFTLLFFGDLIPCFLRGKTTERYFLDICCISQNAEEKLNGVHHLAEYVMVSKKVIVCYTERYTTRLWCVFEMAVFFARLRRLTKSSPLTRLDDGRSWVQKAMKLKDAAQFVFLPLFLPPIAIAISLSLQACLFLLFGFIVSGNVVLGILTACFFVLTFLSIILGARKLHKAASRMHDDFKNFSLDNAHCYSQEDRQMILQSINSFWTSGNSDAHDAGLKAFEHFVHEDMALFIYENFVSPMSALRCLFANSGLVMVQALVLLAFFGFMVPFLMAAFIIDAFVGDAIAEAKGPRLSLRRRVTCRRVTIWILMFIMSTFCGAHAFGYVVEPKVAIPDDLRFAVDGQEKEYPKHMMEAFRQSVLVPNEFTIDGSLFHWACSAAFGGLALLFLSSIVNAAFFRRHAVLPARQAVKPDELDNFSLKATFNWARAWLTYIRIVTKPGAEFYWRRVIVMEFVEFGLQMVKLASYSGRDLYTGESIPAADDKVVVFHTCVLCIDLICIGLCIYFRAVFAAIASEMLVDILYTITPIAALAAFVEPASWYSLRDDNMAIIYFCTTLFPMLRTLSSLSQLDQINLQKVAVLRRSSLPRSSTVSDNPGERASLKTDGRTSALHKMGSRVNEALLDTTGVEGRQQGIVAILELVLRLAAVAGLLTWVFVAMSHPCKELQARDGMRCDWITHPIFESPPCNCKILSGQTFQYNKDSSVYCTIDGIFPFVQVATSVEYLFLRSNPIHPECYLDKDRLSRFSSGWLKHSRGIQFNGALLQSTELPLALSEATHLRSLHVYLSQIAELPDWFANFQELQHFRFVFGQLASVPPVLQKLPNLKELDLDGNPVCADAAQLVGVGDRYDVFQCADSRSQAFTSTSNRTVNGTQNETCADSGGVWELIAAGLQSSCGDVRVPTTCTSFCQIYLTFIIPLDTLEPKGAFSMEEINAEGMQNAMDVWRVGDNSLASVQQLECSLKAYACQANDAAINAEHGLNETTLWLSTLSKFATGGANADEISDCSDCSGTSYLSYYSLELQDPNDPTKRKAGT